MSWGFSTVEPSGLNPPPPFPPSSPPCFPLFPFFLLFFISYMDYFPFFPLSFFFLFINPFFTLDFILYLFIFTFFFLFFSLVYPFLLFISSSPSFICPGARSARICSRTSSGFGDEDSISQDTPHAWTGPSRTATQGTARGVRAADALEGRGGGGGAKGVGCEIPKEIRANGRWRLHRR